MIVTNPVSCLRPQPGNITEAESRYSDITQLDFGVEPSLSGGLKDLLQAGAAMQIERIYADQPRDSVITPRFAGHSSV